MPTVLFVCQGNIFRSQMAEGFFNASAPNGWRAESAGTRPGGRVHPNAVALMKEVGVDISPQRPKPFDPAVAAAAWRVIAMCDLEGCPQQAVHWPITDPALLPEARQYEIRDEIERRVNELIREITT
jgi:arsenate reductase